MENYSNKSTIKSIWVWIETGLNLGSPSSFFCSCSKMKWFYECLPKLNVISFDDSFYLTPLCLFVCKGLSLLEMIRSNQNVNSFLFPSICTTTSGSFVLIRFHSRPLLLFLDTSVPMSLSPSLSLALPDRRKCLLFHFICFHPHLARAGHVLLATFFGHCFTPKSKEWHHQNGIQFPL